MSYKIKQNSVKKHFQIEITFLLFHFNFKYRDDTPKTSHLKNIVFKKK